MHPFPLCIQVFQGIVVCATAQQRNSVSGPSALIQGNFRVAKGLKMIAPLGATLIGDDVHVAAASFFAQSRKTLPGNYNQYRIQKARRLTEPGQKAQFLGLGTLGVLPICALIFK